METEVKQKEVSEENYVEVKDLVTQFFTFKGIVKAIDGVDLSIKKGEIFGLVGESGCGKSVTATSIMDLVPDPPGRIIRGKIFIDGFNILSDLDKLARIFVRSETNVKVRRNKRMIKRHNYILSKIRGDKVAMIFQEPFLALNPVLTIGYQITENIMLHSRIDIINSIIRRETLGKEGVADLLSKLDNAKDYDEKRRVVNRWTRDYGVPETEHSVFDLISHSDNKEYIERELLSLLSQEKMGVDLQPLGVAREYYKADDELFDLNLKLMQAEYNNDQNTAAKLYQQIGAKRSEIRSKYSGFLLKSKLLRKRMEAPLMKEARRRALELLELVNIAGPERVIDSYPHELSGGMQQRAMIAMALAANPKLLIADEPTTALDVTTQAQILELIRELNTVTGSSVLFITHDLAVIAEMCNRVGVMYAGNLVEETSVKKIFQDPKHPYTMGLMRAIPRADKKRDVTQKLESIPGTVPNLITPPSGCRFHPRCKFAMDVCSEKKPKLVEIEKGHKVACFLYSRETVEERGSDALKEIATKVKGGAL